METTVSLIQGLWSLNSTYFEVAASPNVTAAWWSGSEAGLWGGIGGAIIGCMGGLIGVLCGLGRGRALVLGLFKLMFLLGISSGVLGIVALAKSQPYAVYYPLLLCGLLCTILPLFQYKMVERRFQTIARE